MPAGKLQCKQGRGDRTDEKCGKGTGVAGITCNAVAPGFIETDMTDAMTESAKEADSKTDSAGEMQEIQRMWQNL